MDILAGLSIVGGSLFVFYMINRKHFDARKDRLLGKRKGLRFNDFYEKFYRDRADFETVCNALDYLQFQTGIKPGILNPDDVFQGEELSLMSLEGRDYGFFIETAVVDVQRRVEEKFSAEIKEYPEMKNIFINEIIKDFTEIKTLDDYIMIVAKYAEKIGDKKVFKKYPEQKLCKKQG